MERKLPDPPETAPVSAARPAWAARIGRSRTGTMVTDPAVLSRTGIGAAHWGGRNATQIRARSHRSDYIVRRSEKPPQIGADALQHGGLRLGDGKALAGDRLEYADIDPRGLGDDVAWDRRDRVVVGVAARRHPAPQEILVEAVGRLAGRKPAGIALGEPVAAAVRGMDLVGEQDPSVAIEPE